MFQARHREIGNLMLLQGEITTHCVCIKYDAETGEPILDENGEYVPDYENCYGDCYTEQVADFTDNILPEWLTHHNLDKSSPVLIKGSGMTWRGVSGSAVRYADQIIPALQIDSDYILRITCDTETGLLKIVRSSHDEYGALFEIEPVPEPTDD